jgi:hypothetical protein
MEAQAFTFASSPFVPVAIGFFGLGTGYFIWGGQATEVPTRLLGWKSGTRLIGLFQFVTGVWLMYCTYATTVNLALGAKAWI